nr:VOC family protein [Paludibacter propionicigenes]
MPDGKVGHAEIEIEGSLLMMSDENLEWGNKSPLTIGGNPTCIGLYVKDVDKVFQKAIDAGATVVMPIEDAFYGDRVGQVMDPFGYKWMIATHKKAVSFEEMQKLSDEMFAPK